MKEVCFVVCGEAIVWVSMGSMTAIPDSRARWNTIWENRESLSEIVHTHPAGLLRFSQEDLTTMEAVEAALGHSVRWSIVTEGGYLTREEGTDRSRLDQPWWLPVLREISFGRASVRPQQQRKEESNVCTH